MHLGKHECVGGTVIVVRPLCGTDVVGVVEVMQLSGQVAVERCCLPVPSLLPQECTTKAFVAN